MLIALLLGVGLWFTLRFRMIQLKALLLSVKLVGSKGEPGSISSFQAFATEPRAASAPATSPASRSR